jgi:predicted KAP-like P-loop ATPase
MINSNTGSLLSSDSPLTHPDQDELDYSPFAQIMAKAIVNMSPSDGLVMSLNGPWGSGKSTVLNFVIYYLTQYDLDKQPIIVQFNPWWFSDREDLIRLLIGQIRTALGRKDFSELRKKLAAFSELVSNIPSLPGREIGKTAAKLLDLQPNIISLKKSIGKLLLDGKKKILVIVDDIDRLPPDEIRELFRTIKATANFPNTIYLLAFDNQVVTDALERGFVTSGKDYLEKIVQVPFVLPSPDKFSLRRLLFSKLDNILIKTPSELFDKTYWTNTFFEGIDHYIHTPRDVTRLFNALRATYPALVGEVNPVDYIAIEAIRVFSPGFYEIIQANAEQLSGTYSSWGTTVQEKNQEKAKFDEWLEIVPQKNRSGLKRLMINLFPKFAGTYGGTSYAPDYIRIWQKQLRVCSPDHFSIYFKFSVSRDSISNAEMNVLLNKTSNSEEFSTALVEYSKQHRRDGSTRLRIILERLEVYTHDIPIDHISVVINSFFQIGDELLKKEDKPKGIFDFDNEMLILRINYQILLRLSQEQRFSIYQDAIEKGNSISIIEMEVTVLGQEHGKFGGEIKRPEPDRVVNGHQLEKLENLALTKIRYAVKQGKLIDSPKLPSILFRWKAWSENEDEVRAWVAEVTSTDDSLARFISYFGKIQRSQSFGEYALRERFRLDPEWIKPFADPDLFYPRLHKMLTENNIPDEYKKAVEQFCTEYEMRQREEDPNARR